MIVRCGLAKKNDNLTDEQFAEHWLNVHGPLAAEMKNLRAYKQNLVIDREHRHPIGGGNIDIDGLSELHFDDFTAMLEGVQSVDKETGNALLDDAEVLLNKRLCDILVFDRRVVREVPAYLRDRKDLIHRIAFIRRSENVTAAEFQREWCYAHAKLVEAVPGHAGYAQNLVMARYVDGKPATYDQLPCDAMVEFYFENWDAFNCFYDSEEFKRLAAHGTGFIGTIDTYLVQTTDVVKHPADGGYWM